MPKPPKLIGSVEAARILGKSSRTIHRLVTSGQLRPAMTAPGGAHGTHLFDPREIERFKAEREAAA